MDYPDEFEQFDYGIMEFEDKYAEEFEALNEIEDDLESPLPPCTLAKRRLDFGNEVKDPDVVKVQKLKDEQINAPSAKRPRLDNSDNQESTLPNLRDSEDAGDSSTTETLSCDLKETLNHSLYSPPNDIDRNTPKKGTPVPLIRKSTAKLCSKKPKSYETISVTTFDGNTIHLRLKDSADFLSTEITEKKTNLLAYPYLIVHSEAMRILEQKEIFKQENKFAPVNKISKNPSSLWVEKFKPEQYIELLSDDGINRALLSWLKLWDKVVFNRYCPGKVHKELEEGKPKFQEVIKDLDSLGRPQQKYALLCGPPGLGKTTLAYIIAKYAGYNPVELNASDDRSPDVFKRQLEASTQMRSVMGEDPRPNCLIIDEIDGAPAPSINVLLNFAKNIKKSVLLRPVICICNDLYTPTLRPLRQISFVLTFPPTCSARLTSRLLEISRAQNLKTDRAAIAALCEKADNDIRSCLNTMQFLHNIKSKLKLKDVKLASIGQKDTQVSMFTVWQKVFQVPRTNSKWSGQGNNENETSLVGRFNKILSLTQSFGEYEKVLQGLFENYLNVNYRDLHFHRTCFGADWLCFTSELQQMISQSQIYSIMPYIPYAVVAFHFLFAVLSNVTVSFPSQQVDHKTNMTKHENIIAALMQDMSPIARSSLNSQEIVLNFLPNLIQIVQPSLRPVNTQLYSTKEKKELRHVIDTMVAYNLNYRQERNLEGMYQFVLDPHVDEVISFPGIKPQNSLSYGAKQLISRELEVERLRRNEKLNPNSIRVPIEKKVVIPNNQEVLKPKIGVVEKPVKVEDFFGRKLTAVEKIDDSNVKMGNVWFQFKEGYTNAARKILYMRDLM